MITLKIIVLFTVIVPLHYDFCWCQCARAEYEIGGECCPMCAAGNRVVWHCTDDTSTTCVPCPEFTYNDEPSGFTKCLTCTVCDASDSASEEMQASCSGVTVPNVTGWKKRDTHHEGLRVNKACTRMSDTVCEPREQFYCTERIKDSCRNAAKHSECSPGQYIKQAGTPSTDTVCADCEADTYSNGSFLFCLPHTQCEALGLAETSPGTRSSDRECGNTTTLLLIIVSSVLVTLIIIAVVIVFTVIQKKRRSNHSVDDDCIKAEPNGLEEEDLTNSVSILIQF